MAPTPPVDRLPDLPEALTVALDRLRRHVHEHCGSVAGAGGIGWVLIRDSLPGERAFPPPETPVPVQPAGGVDVDDEFLFFRLHAAGPAGGRALLDTIGEVDDEPRADWLERLDWRDSGAASRRLRRRMALDVARAELEGDAGARAALLATLAWLEARQDQASGLWGTAASGGLRPRIEATASILPFFSYVHRPMPRTGRMTDTVLAAVSAGELSTTPDGSERRGIVEVLATAHLASRYREPEVRSALLGLHQQLAQQIVPGVDALLLDPARAVSGPAILDLWLDLAALARARAALAGAASHDELGWRPRDWPGPGFCPLPGRLTAHQRHVIGRWLPSFEGAGGAGRAAGVEATVVIPCFNLGRYLPEAIQSALSQDRPVDVIVVDDGSDDDLTIEVVAAFERAGGSVVRQANRGLAEARNAGIARAATPYVCCLDADDRLRPAFAARALELLTTDAAMGFVNMGMQWFDESDHLVPAYACDLPDMLVHNRAIVGAVFRRDAWEAVGGYFGGFSAAGIEDWDFWLRLLSAGYRAGIVQEPLYEYRVRAGSMSQGMYEPDRWRRLMGELAVRHAAAYQRHLPDVIGALAAREAEMRNWALERGRAIAWWERKAGEWQQVAEDRGRTIADLRAWVDELERAKDWNDEQRRHWERIARSAGGRAALDES